MSNVGATKVAAKPKGEGLLGRVFRFVRESYVETRYKSAWPTWAELRSFTLVVIFALVVVSIWIGGLDYIIGQLTRSLGQ